MNKDFNAQAGPIEDLPMCKCSENGIVNPYKDTYCKYKSDAGVWSYIEPRP